MQILEHDLDKWLEYTYNDTYGHHAFYDIKNDIQMCVSKSCIYATKCGSIKCLKYLSTIPCFIIDNYSLSVAIWNNRTICLDFLYSNLECKGKLETIKKNIKNMSESENRYFDIMQS